MLGVIKLVNDSLHQPNIKGLPEELFPLGSLIYQETFLVLTIKTQSQASCQHSLILSIIFTFQARDSKGMSELPQIKLVKSGVLRVV